MTPAQRAELERLLTAFADAQVECGEWRKDESDEPYDAVYKVADAARKDLVTYFESLAR